MLEWTKKKKKKKVSGSHQDQYRHQLYITARHAFQLWFSKLYTLTGMPSARMEKIWTKSCAVRITSILLRRVSIGFGNMRGYNTSDNRNKLVWKTLQKRVIKKTNNNKKKRKRCDLACCNRHTHFLRLQNPLTSPLSWPSRPGEIGGVSELSAFNLLKKKLWIIVPQYESGWLIACDKSCCVLSLSFSLSLQGLLPQPADSPNHPSVPSNTLQCTCMRAAMCSSVGEKKKRTGEKEKSFWSDFFRDRKC